MDQTDAVGEQGIIRGAKMLESVIADLEIRPCSDLIQRSNGLGLTVHRGMTHPQRLDIAFDAGIGEDRLQRAQAFPKSRPGGGVLLLSWVLVAAKKHTPPRHD